MFDEEWAVVGSSVVSRRRLAAWQDGDPRLRGCRSPADLIARIRHGDLFDSRELCHGLLALVGHDEFAVRVLLQAMMPSLTNELVRLLVPVRASSSTSFTADDGEVDQILVCAANQAVHEHAGSISMWPMSDLVHRTHRLVVQRIRHERRWMSANCVTDEVLFGTVAPPPGEEPDSSVEALAVLLRDVAREGRVAKADVALVWKSRLAGFDSAEMAGELGVSTDTFLRRRHRAESRIVEAMREVA